MVNIKIKSSILAGLTSLLLAFSTLGFLRSGSLLDVAKPYLGEYECTRAEWDGKDVLPNYQFIRLELKGDNSFILHYKEKIGELKSEKGKYRYDKKKETVTMQLSGFQCYKKEFPLQKGVLTIDLSMGTKNIIIQFEQR